MLDRITRVTEAFFEDVEDEGVVQAQREALIDLLVWTMLVDNHIGLAEQDHLEGLIDRLDWQAPLQLTQYLGMAYARVRAALPPADPAQLLASISRRLETDDMKQRALRFANDLAESDGDRSATEVGFLDHISKAFASG